MDLQYACINQTKKFMKLYYQASFKQSKLVKTLLLQMAPKSQQAHNLLLVMLLILHGKKYYSGFFLMSQRHNVFGRTHTIV
jgi:hypothetical protein